ncbi:dihydrolipoamide acetyltransferase family protein [Lacisediminihabitans sp.]|uniref:dihydrolipoamide acetyltransferase family protein n=1 Tax=Lacisediminihabitans sp. TaxID=2787631 RepID=UPI00374DF145
MTVTREFALPDLGEGLTESELVSWHVAVGDTVELNQPIAEVETAKAIVQLPSPFAGVVSRLYAEEGATVLVGALIAAFEVEFDGAPVERTPVLVGYGPVVEDTGTPQRKKRGAAPAVVELVETISVVEPATVAERPMSTPPVRKLAQDLGVDLERVVGTGEGGLVTRDDVQAAAVSTRSTSGRGSTTSASGGESRVPIKGVRKATAAAMVSSAFTAPHVTEFLTIDVTPTSELLGRLRESREFREHRLTMLALIAKAMCIAAKRTPEVNSRWDEAAGEIVQFGHVNLGIAVATPRGLMVPNIRDADSLSLVDLTDAITALAETARGGDTARAALSGGTISITNVGVFGVDAGTPILNPGEAAILAMGAVRRLPWEHHGEIALRDVMTLSLSFDHRLVDGEQGSRFLVDVGSMLADPGTVMAML